MARTENLTIMFTDVVGYTQRTAAQSRAENKAMLQRCNRLLLPLANHFGGRHVKSIGDALLLAFRSPTDAVRCGMAMHDALTESNHPLPKNQHIHIRVAINVGEVLVENGDVFGEAVNVAARVEPITPEDTIYFTEAVYLAMNKAEVPSQVVGTERLKGIPEPVKIYTVPPHQLNRLIPTGRVLNGKVVNGSLLELPYGGMHMRPVETGPWVQLKNSLLEVRFSAAYLRDHWNRPKQVAADLRGGRTTHRQWVTTGLWLSLLVSVSLAAWYWREPVVEPSFSHQAEPLLVVRQLDQAKALYEARLAQNPNDAEAWLVKGHVLYAQDDKQGALNAYERALTLNPELRTDARLVVNLVSSLGWVSAYRLGALLTKHSTPMAVDTLSARTGQPGARGRHRAVEILERIGQARRIDRFGLALQDLRESETCEDRLDAIKRLRALRDRRALPDLEALQTGGFSGWLNSSNSCLRSEANTTIEELRQR